MILVALLPRYPPRYFPSPCFFTNLLNVSEFMFLSTVYHSSVFIFIFTFMSRFKCTAFIYTMFTWARFQLHYKSFYSFLTVCSTCKTGNSETWLVANSRHLRLGTWGLMVW